MEFLKGAVVAGLWGCLVSLALGLLLAVLAALGADVSPLKFLLGVIAGAFVFGLFIGVWLVPLSVLLGLLYVIIRRAVRVERSGGDTVSGP